jgi:hypothetical protein
MTDEERESSDGLLAHAWRRLGGDLWTLAGLSDDTLERLILGEAFNMVIRTNPDDGDFIRARQRILKQTPRTPRIKVDWKREGF